MVMQEVTLKAMSKQVQAIAVKYRMAKIQVMMFHPSMDDNQKQMYEFNSKFIDAFHYLIDNMVPENREIILNDYLQKKGQSWWLDSYARSTYYRQKNLALKELLTFLK
jgi:hypothetical protein